MGKGSLSLDNLLGPSWDTREIRRHASDDQIPKEVRAMHNKFRIFSSTHDVSIRRCGMLRHPLVRFEQDN